MNPFESYLHHTLKSLIVVTCAHHTHTSDICNVDAECTLVLLSLLLHLYSFEHHAHAALA